MKYLFLFTVVAFLPPALYLIGLALIYWSILGSGLRIFNILFDPMPVKKLFSLTQTVYMKNKMIKNGVTSSSVTTSSPLPSQGVAANAKTP
jgi:hypothetical protein